MVLAAVKHHGSALVFASHDLRNDREVVLEAFGSSKDSGACFLYFLLESLDRSKTYIMQTFFATFLGAQKEEQMMCLTV